MEDLQILINNIPNILIYIIPGFIFLKTVTFIVDKELKDSNFVFSAALSFIITTFVKLFIVDSDIWIYNAMCILVAVVSGVLCSIMFKSNKFNDFFRWLCNESVNDSMWEEIKDDKNVFIKTYISIDQVIYYGRYIGYEKKDSNIYVLITDYEITKYNGDKVKDYSDDKHCFAMINTKDISRVEIFYVEDSMKYKKYS